MTTLHECKVEYRPCQCPSHSQPANNKGDVVVPNDPAEHFEVKVVAALRFRQLLTEGKEPRVHHLGTHVSAVVLNGERFEEG